MILSRRWAPNDNRSVRSHQKLVDAINQVSTLRQTDASTAVSPGGTTNIPVRRFDYYEVRWVVIVDEGPDGDDDYADERYWGKFCEINEADEITALSVTPTVPVDTDPGESDEEYASPNIITFTNVPEIRDHSHLLEVSDEQPIMVMRVIGPDYVGHWFSVVSLSGPAEYYGKILGYEAGSNIVTLTPCEEDGTPTGEDDVEVSITLPVTRTQCSFFGGDVDDILVYKVKGSMKWLASVPLVIGTTQSDVFQITASAGGAQGGFDSVRVK